VGIHGRMLRRITTIGHHQRRRPAGHRLRRQTQGAATPMADTRTGAARTNHRQARVHRVTRTRHRITTAEGAARTRHPLIPLRAAVIRLRRVLTQRRRLALIRHHPLGPIPRLPGLTQHRAIVTVAVEAGVVAEVEVAHVAEAAEGVRMEAAALTGAALTDTNVSSKKPAPNWGGLFLCPRG
jgi:hypothetical protein